MIIIDILGGLIFGALKFVLAYLIVAALMIGAIVWWFG